MEITQAMLDGTLPLPIRPEDMPAWLWSHAYRYALPSLGNDHAEAYADWYVSRWMPTDNTWSAHNSERYGVPTWQAMTKERAHGL